MAGWQPPPDQLNEREIEILERLAKGLTDQQIAQELFLSLNTVKWYNRQIYNKLGVNSRTQAVANFHALKEIDAGAPVEPVARTLYRTTASQEMPANNLPAEVTRFIGRKRETDDVKGLLNKSRFVTLTGLPGTGKTRLALHVAREEAHTYRDGVFFIPLAPVRTADNILWAITEHLNFQFESHGKPLGQLLSYLHDKNYLLVLDNFDHLIAGGEVLMEILRAAPAVKLLVTSRERLRLYGEVCYILGGLTLPDENQIEEAVQSEAVELFIDKAHSVSPYMDWKHDNLQSAIRICRLVEGIPLGIELAATWVDTLLPKEIADEIEHNIDILEAERQDVPQSQRSIRAAFDRSWNLLDETQERAFRRLSVFRGGFTREAGEAVAGIRLRTLQALVNKSLLRHNLDTGRYEIHELMRQYSQEKLEQSGEAENIYHAHAAYFADFMAERWPWMKDRRQKNALQEMEADLENARAAWHYWIKACDVAQLRKFFHSFWVIYDVRGWYPAGIDLFEQAVQVMHTVSTDEAKICLGWLLAVQGMYSVPVVDNDKLWDAGSMQLLTEFGLYNVTESGPRTGFNLAQNGIEILKKLGKYDEMMIVPLISLFFTASQLSEEDAISLRAAQECLEVGLKINDHWVIAKAKQFLALRAIEAGDYQEGERLAHEALSAFEASGDQWSLCFVYIEVLGLHAINQRQLRTAKGWIQKGLEAAKEIDFKYSIQTAYWQLGYVAALEEKYAEAGIYWHKALEVSDRMLGGRSFIGMGAAAVVRNN